MPSFYPVYYSVSSLTLISLPAMPVFAVVGLLNQMLYRSQSISDGFNKLILGSLTILATTNFFKAFDSISDGFSTSLFLLSSLLALFGSFQQAYFCWPLALLCSVNSIFSY